MSELDDDVHVLGISGSLWKWARRDLDAEIRPAIVSGMVTGDVPVSYWPIFFFSP